MKIEINSSLEITNFPTPINYNGIKIGELIEAKNDLYIGEIEEKYSHLFINESVSIEIEKINLKGEKE